MSKLKVFICDLTHTGAKIATENMPLGAGFIYGYARKHVADVADFTLIKYPEDLLNRLKTERPDVVSFANYVWCNDLNEYFCKLIKQIDEKIITIKGGPNYPVHEAEQTAYLEKHVYTDAYIDHEGEIAFVNFIRAVIERGQKWHHQTIDGVDFLDKFGGNVAAGRPAPLIKIQNRALLAPAGAHRLIKGKAIPRIRDLTNTVPSPYLEGYLDPFFDGKLTPVIQRTRGCPFTCNFCNEGVEYYNKINKFDTERTIDELHYIGQRVAKHGIRNLIITDMNFGMYQEDLQIAHEIKKCQKQYGWPLNILATTGKNRVDRIAEVFKSLEDTVVISMSMQSMSETVLQTIKRQNIKPEMYVKLTSGMANQPKLAELILPLPNETFQSYLDSNKFLINAGVDKVLNYTLQRNMGTDYDSDSYLRKYDYKMYFRVYANCFGIYNGDVVMEAEEVGIATNTISEDDYYGIRKFAFLVELVHNNGLFGEYFKLLKSYDIPPFDFVHYCFNHIDDTDSDTRKAFQAFVDETKGELFPTESALKSHYLNRDNYNRLIAGEVGRNVLYSNKAIVLATILDSLVHFVSGNFENFIRENKLDVSAAEIDDITRFTRAKLRGILTASTAEGRERFHFDMLRWLESDRGRLKDFPNPARLECVFYFDEKQQVERADLFGRYGDDVLGAMKILARVPNHQKLVRKVRAESRSLQAQAA